MASLKASLPRLASTFGMTIDALYERQRALVRHGILKPIEGRGPGSGVEFSANSAATLLIGVAAVNSLSEVDGRIAAFCEAMPDSASETCSFTGQTTFLGALQAILEDPRLNFKVRTVSIGLNTSNIFIGYAARDSRKMLRSHFNRLAETRFQGITKTAVIDAVVLQNIHLSLPK